MNNRKYHSDARSLICFHGPVPNAELRAAHGRAGTPELIELTAPSVGTGASADRSKILALVIALGRWGMKGDCRLYIIDGDLVLPLMVPVRVDPTSTGDECALPSSQWVLHCREQIECQWATGWCPLTDLNAEFYDGFPIVISLSGFVSAKYPETSLLITTSRTANTVQLEFLSNLFDGGLLQAFAVYWLHLLRKVKLKGEQCLHAGRDAQFPLSVQRQMLNVAPLNQVLPEQRETRCGGIIDQLLVCALRAPEATALIYEDQEFSYAQLLNQVKILASVIGEVTKAGERVAICLPRSAQSVVAFLAVIYCARVYVPVDISYPLEHSKALFSLAQPKLMLCMKTWSDQADFSTPRIFVDELLAVSSELSSADCPPLRYCEDDHFCILFTSGSTGRAKAVVHGERSFVERFAWQWQQCEVQENDVFCLRTTVNFGPHIWEMLGGLLKGVPTVVLNEEQFKQPLVFIRVLLSKRVTRFSLVPSMAKVLIASLESQQEYRSSDNPFAHVTCVSIAGEAVAQELLVALRRWFPRARIFNDFGSTETNCLFFTEYTDSIEVYTGQSLLGRASSAATIQVLDSSGAAVGPFESGYLHVAGPTLAQGILEGGRLRKLVYGTKATVGASTYGTGDRVYFDLVGNIYSLGRSDSQVKIRSARVNLESVNEAVAIILQVKESAVIARKTSSGEMQLIAFVCPGNCTESDLQANANQFIASQLLEKLSAQLPPHYLPAQLFVRDSLPRLENGKLDRVWLNEFISKSVNEPNAADDLEGTLVRLIAQVTELSVNEEVAFSSSLSELGVDSLSVVQLVLRINETFKIELSLDSVFRRPDFIGLCEIISELCDGTVFPRRIGLVLDQVIDVAQDLDTLYQYIGQLPQSKVQYLAPLSGCLVTGAAGYVGCHLVHQLLLESRQVVCIIRAVSNEQAWEKLLTVMSKYRLTISSDQIKNLRVYSGDITVTNFGLSWFDYRELLDQVGHLFHLAAEVNHLSCYGSLRTPLCLAWRNLAAFVSQSGVRNITFCSSVSVNRLADGNVWSAELPVPRDLSIASGYGQTKWLGEQVLELLSRRYSISTFSLRFGEIGLNLSTGVSRDDDLVHNFLNIIQSMEVLPESSAINHRKLVVDILPVDWVSEFMAKLSQSAITGCLILNCANASPIDLFSMLKAGEPEIQRNKLSWNNWLEAFNEKAINSGSQLLGGIGTFTCVSGGDPIWISYFLDTQVDTSGFKALIKKFNFVNPSVGRDYIDLCAVNWREIGFLILNDDN